MPEPDLVILGSGSESWHGARLREACTAEGLAVHRVAFGRCGFAIGPNGTSGLRLSDLDALPRAVLVRSIPAGSFEQVTLRLSLLHALEAAGVAVVNSARAIERCVDKAMTSFLLARAGLPVPATWVAENQEVARAIVAREASRASPLVLKPLFGAQGKGLRLVRDADELPPPEEVGGVFYLQRFVGRDDGWHDFRVFVVGREPVAAMVRHGTSWVTNIRQGAVPAAVPVGGALGELAAAAAAAVGTEHAGVDLIADAAGRLQILEVNSMPAWQGLQSVAPVDIAAAIARHLARRVGLLRPAA